MMLKTSWLLVKLKVYPSEDGRFVPSEGLSIKPLKMQHPLPSPDNPFQPVGQPVGLPRRLGAIAYDALVLFAILIFAHLPVQVLFGTTVISPGDTWHLAYQAYLLGVCFLYFGWCWTHGGQTLGMRTWRVYLGNQRGGRVSWRQSWIRFLCAILSWSVFGAGFLWALFDGERMAWHDRFSGTVLLLVPR
uniref:Uncharacterized membrane protein YckC, RDD family n=1 Tax=Candidatus Kentrum eta TaxID=2126337 RepID=A0A450VNV8_9GAMM|nr:MAG: Uncharacterized membrane protein YckC, RDD family [Candidatus Kentron sp. H]VFK04066.1 MAG: Uncharacterized membrane protein YckC, RDD family [Candidatus Kentron sp. H]VFK06492.1 MAG: Uncharacterized membrane protein YckC, RDD family [Candidatus Kentron sp. H]